MYTGILYTLYRVQKIIFPSGLNSLSIIKIRIYTVLLLRHMRITSVVDLCLILLHTVQLRKVNVRFKTCGDGTAGKL